MLLIPYEEMEKNVWTIFLLHTTPQKDELQWPVLYFHLTLAIFSLLSSKDEKGDKID